MVYFHVIKVSINPRCALRGLADFDGPDVADKSHSRKSQTNPSSMADGRGNVYLWNCLVFPLLELQ
jgi:hypothetical protein